jgi:nitrite reductase/ring-hydroxylating ferredoxin subunit/ferredoxin
MTSTVSVSARAWHPVASSSDLVPRHVYQGQLHGRELAVWRADDGFVNVWENRCLHRGVRLSIAVNDGRELTCQYHGWRYSSRTAGCTYIPAHPADAPARTIANRTYPVVERHGLVWTTLDGDAPDDVPALGDAGSGPFPLRPVVVAAPPAAVAGQLRGYGAAAGLRLAAAGEPQLRFTVRDAGVDLPSSCEQGACGTCIATVIEGDPVHQDVYLNAAEKAAGDTILTCVSRCSSSRLVLDL